MKKILSILIISISFFNLIFSEPLKQFQTFSWKKVAKAKKYEIAVEKENEDGSYIAEVSEQLTDTRIELLLYPGSYRVAISVFNVLGKKTSTSNWTNFIILDETEPYLYADSFKKSQRWNSPILNLKQGGVQIVEEQDDEGSVVAREGDPTNSFFLHGKNIFFEETSFSMIPKATTENGTPFEAYVDLRKEVPLNIFRRDTENGGVVVEYNPEELFSGYYDIVVKNPGEKQTSIELLVLSFQPPVIDNSIYAYDENYKVNVLNVTQGTAYNLKIQGTGFDNNTLYTFTPDSTLPPYPFASGFDLENPSFYMESHTCLDEKGTIAINLNLSTQNLHTGYYCFRANNGTAGSDSIIFLIKVNPAPNYAPSIAKVKTKTSGTSNTVLFNVTGKNIDEDSKITLIAPYSEEADNNKRIPITYLENKKKGELHVMQTDKDNIEPGRYALLVENTVSSALFYFDIDEKYIFNLCNLSDFESESLFLRPKSKKQIDFTVEKVIESNFEELKVATEYNYGPKKILSATHMNASVISFPGISTYGNDMDYEFKVDLLNLLWFRLDAGIQYFTRESYGLSGLKYGGDLFFEIPGNFCQPYVGAGFYSTQNSQFSIAAQAGARFFHLFELTYQLELQDALTPNEYFIDKFSIGAQIPIRGYTYTSKKSTMYSNYKIAENDIIDGTQYIIKKNAKSLTLDSRSITGFEGLNSINSITLSDNVKSIGRKAFANMPALESIILKNSLVSIGEQAFANDTRIQFITIPLSVTSIEANAFEGWTGGQIIYLSWSSDDETPRNLVGLDTTNAYVEYLDKVPYKAQFFPYDTSNWSHVLNNSTGFVERSSVQNKKGIYIPQVTLSGQNIVADGVSGFTCYTLRADSVSENFYDENIKAFQFQCENASEKIEAEIKILFRENGSQNTQEQVFKIEAGKTKNIVVNFEGQLNKIVYMTVIPRTVESEIIYKNAFITYNINLQNFEIIK